MRRYKTDNQLFIEFKEYLKERNLIALNHIINTYNDGRIKNIDIIFSFNNEHIWVTVGPENYNLLREESFRYVYINFTEALAKKIFRENKEKILSFTNNYEFTRCLELEIEKYKYNKECKRCQDH